MQLPPKRYQEDGDTKFDSIRHHPWFASLATRREKIGILEMAAREMFWDHVTLKKASEAWGVDEKELRDYVEFNRGNSKFAELSDSDKKVYQLLLDQSYDAYFALGGGRAFTKVIYEQSLLFGTSPRHVVELWETCPAFYPTHYRGTR